MANSTQIRMARAGLNLKVRELAELAQVSPNTITRVEADLPVNAATLKALQAALESKGIEFTNDGVRLHPDPFAREVYAKIKNAIPDLYFYVKQATIGGIEVDYAAATKDYKRIFVQALKSPTDAPNQLLNALSKHPDSRLIVVTQEEVAEEYADKRFEYWTFKDGILRRYR